MLWRRQWRWMRGKFSVFLCNANGKSDFGYMESHESNFKLFRKQKCEWRAATTRLKRGKGREKSILNISYTNPYTEEEKLLKLAFIKMFWVKEIPIRKSLDGSFLWCAAHISFFSCSLSQTNNGFFDYGRVKIKKMGKTQWSENLRIKNELSRACDEDRMADNRTENHSKTFKIIWYILSRLPLNNDMNERCERW